MLQEIDLTSDKQEKRHISFSTYVGHTHKARDLCGHAQVAEEALVSAPEAAPQHIAAPCRLVIRCSRL